MTYFKYKISVPKESFKFHHCYTFQNLNRKWLIIVFKYLQWNKKTMGEWEHYDTGEAFTTNIQDPWDTRKLQSNFFYYTYVHVFI